MIKAAMQALKKSVVCEAVLVLASELEVTEVEGLEISVLETAEFSGFGLTTVAIRLSK